MLHAYIQRFDVMKRECKNLEFGKYLNQAVVSIYEAMHCRNPKGVYH
jgi:hypothetical protein